MNPQLTIVTTSEDERNPFHKKQVLTDILHRFTYIRDEAEGVMHLKGLSSMIDSF